MHIVCLVFLITLYFLLLIKKTIHIKSLFELY